MRIEHATRETCGDATGAVVAIDVIRAFTTAAFAFAASARDVVLVGEVEEALALRALSRRAGDGRGWRAADPRLRLR